MATLEERVEALEHRANQYPADEIAPHDSTWTCDSCGTLLGRYHLGDKVLRTKVRDQMSFTHLGAGGSITVICRKCAQPNTLEQAQLEQLSAEATKNLLGQSGATG